LFHISFFYKSIVFININKALDKFIFRKTIFVLQMNLVDQISTDNSMIFSFIALSFFCLGILRAFYWKYTRLMLIAAFKFRYASQYLRQENVFTERVNWISFLILIINFALIFSFFDISYQSGRISILIFSLIFFYAAKSLIIKSLGKLLLSDEISRLTIFYSFLSDKALAVTITPLVLVLYFFSFDVEINILFFIFFLAILFLLFKLYWVWNVGTNYFGLSSIYIFLYLCILEIYPFVFITKGFFY